MESLPAALADLIDILGEFGIAATTNPGQIQVPGAWISPRELELTRLDGGGQVTVHVWLVVPDAEEDQALPGLWTLLDAALPVLDVDTTNGDTIQLAATLVVRDEGPLPAFQITTTLDL